MKAKGRLATEACLCFSRRTDIKEVRFGNEQIGSNYSDKYQNYSKGKMYAKGIFEHQEDVGTQVQYST